jgi:hypothetical protein
MTHPADLVRRPTFGGLPVLVACLTIFAFSAPVLASILLHDRVVVPDGWTRALRVSPQAGLLAILINLCFLAVLVTAPAYRLQLPSWRGGAGVRRMVALGYAVTSVLSFAVMAIRLDMLPMLLSNPLLGVISFGARLGEEKLLLFFFLGMAVFIGKALIDDRDPGWLRWSYAVVTAGSLVFYLLLGRREIVLLCLCFMMLTARTLDFRSVRTYVYFGVPLLLLMALGLSRLSDSADFGLNAEELSPVALSAYVLEHEAPVALARLPEGTFLRMTVPGLKAISQNYFMHEVDSGDLPTPVLGLAGIAYLYWFFFHVIFVWLLGVAAKSAWKTYLEADSQVMRVLAVFLSFKIFNLFRNGELPIVSLDIVMFAVLIAPALLVAVRAPAPARAVA